MAGCRSHPTQQDGRIPLFEHDIRGIVIPATIGDSLEVNLSFDTGAYMGCFRLDSAFCASNPSPLWSEAPDRVGKILNTAWVPASEAQPRDWRFFDKEITAKIAGDQLHFSYFDIVNMVDFTAELDGMFNFSWEDTTHVWELNFEHEYLEIHDVADFEMPDDCYRFQLIKGTRHNSVYIQFPITFTTVDGDSIAIDGPYILDTGALMDFSILNPAEGLDFFRGKKAQALVSRGSGYQSRYDVGAVAFGDMEIDSMRVYTHENHNTGTPYIIGLNFLKRFNVFFDLSTGTVGLQPIDNFKRTVNPYFRKYYRSLQVTNDGRLFIKEMADVENNYYKEAGLMAGDEIIAMNGRSVKESPANKLPDITIRTKTYDIVRGGTPMTITVHIDPEVEWGE